MQGEAQPTEPHRTPPAHATGGASDLASQLAPALREACDGRLSDIRWFRADWQRGGAATGYADFTFDDGPREVVIKLPVGPVEHRFTTALGATDAPTPRIAASGMELGGYDLAWLVIERLPGEPLSRGAEAKVIRGVLEAAAVFQMRAGERWAPEGRGPQAPWEELVARAREAVKANPIPEQQRWNEALKKVQRALPVMLERWEARPIDAWCHGDLHLGNAMVRPEGSQWGGAGCVLLDLAEIHPGSWVEDAVYLERIYWGRSDALHGVKPVSTLARARRKLGLENGEHYNEIADLRRVLTAACAPAFLHREGAPAYLHAALETIERLLPAAAH
jgi:hypothetical protein